MCGEIVNPIALLTKRITNKNATASSLIKFMLRCEVSGIAKAPRSTKMSICGLHCVKHFVW